MTEIVEINEMDAEGWEVIEMPAEIFCDESVWKSLMKEAKIKSFVKRLNRYYVKSRTY